MSTSFQDEKFAKLSLSLGVIIVLMFGIYVVAYARYTKTEVKDFDDFLTARNSVGWISIGWSFYASAVGSGVITAPAEIGFFGGILSVVAYAVAIGVPILLLGFVAPKIQKMYPDVVSLSDFIKFRFKGTITQKFVVCISLLNMSAASVAEYTTLASIYGDFVGLDNLAFLFVIYVAIVTLTYTAIGGLRASIITDKAQAASSFVLAIIVVIFVSIDFSREEIRQDQISSNTTVSTFDFTDELKGFNTAGYSGLFTLPLSLITATMFSEAMWQRTWAAKDDVALRKGSIMGFVLVFFLVGLIGSFGLIVRWAEIISLDTANSGDFNTNLFVFQIFSDQRGKQLVSCFISVVVIQLGTILAEGNLDSLQNGIEASISGAIKQYFTDEENLKIARTLLILLNTPLVIIGLQKFSILSVFLFSNMICICAFLPIALSFFDDERLNHLHRDWVPVTVFLISLVATMIFSEIYVEGPFGEGLKFAFWDNILYEYQFFVFALLCSTSVTASIYGYLHHTSKQESTVTKTVDEAFLGENLTL